MSIILHAVLSVVTYMAVNEQLTFATCDYWVEASLSEESLGSPVVNKESKALRPSSMFHHPSLNPTWAAK